MTINFEDNQTMLLHLTIDIATLIIPLPNSIDELLEALLIFCSLKLPKPSSEILIFDISNWLQNRFLSTSILQRIAMLRSKVPSIWPNWYWCNNYCRLRSEKRVMRVGSIIKIATARIRAWVLRATIWGTNHYTTVATLATPSNQQDINHTCMLIGKIS